MLVLLPVIDETYHTRFYHGEGRQAGANWLSMVLSSGSFQFAVFDAEKKVLRELCHVSVPASGSEGLLSDQGALEFLLNNYSLVNARFEKVFVSLLHADFALMPVSFSTETLPKNVLAFMGAEQGPSAGARHRLGDIEFCYRTALPVQQLLERSFSNALIRHSGSVAIDLFLSHPDLSACTIFLNINGSVIELLAGKNRQLLFYNVFTVQTNEDILYFLLFMAEQFHLPAKEITIGVGGDADEELLSLLKKFTGHVTLPGETTSFPFTGKFSSLSKHAYFTLLNQHLCEL